MANTNLSSSIDDIQIYRDNYIREINNSNDKTAFTNNNADSLFALGLTMYSRNNSFDSLVYNAFASSALDEDISLHPEQRKVLSLIEENKGLVFSAPTSFGKTFIVFEYICRHKPHTVVMVVPTLALIDEYKQKIIKKYKSRFSEYSIHLSIDPDKKYDFSKKNIFIVTHDRVIDENRDLLDFTQVKNYLSFIAPVPFQNTFPYKREIHKHAQEIGYTIDEYRIKMNGEQIFKKYSTHFKTSKGDDEVFGVEFKDFYDDKGNLVMWLWFGLSKFKAIISKECDMRGLRLRKENIQIGNDDALQGLFKEDRGQHYYIGEMYAVSKFLIPNSQRDYFNENATRAWFEQEVRKYFREVLTKIYYDASRINSSFSKIDSFDKKRQEHEEKIEKHDYVDAEHAQRATDDLSTARDAAEKAQGDLKRLEKSGGETEVSAVRQKVIQRIKKDRQQEEKTPVDVDIPPIETPPPPTKQPHRTDRLSRCNKKERVLISKIFSIILSSTDDKTAETIIQKIEEEFK